MITGTTTHATLLLRISSGSDPSAWREFQDRYEQLIRGFGKRYNLQAADCDEVVQEVFTALCQSITGFRYDPAKGKFRSYLKTVAVHAVYHKIRQKPRGTMLELIEAAAENPADDASSDQAWETEWRQHHLRLAMDRIRMEFNAADVAAFEAYAVAGQDARQTADALKLSMDQVYQAKSRILKRLAEVIADQVREEG